MEEYTITELGSFITICAGATATILFALQKSSCVTIKFCGCECIRDPKLVKRHLDPTTSSPSGDTPRPKELTPSNP